MKLQGILMNHTHQLGTIAEYVAASKEKISCGFTTHYLPLLYSGTADTVMQNIAIALIGSIVSLVDINSLLKMVKSKLPELKAISAHQQNGMNVLSVLVYAQNGAYQLTFSHPGKMLVEDFKKLVEITSQFIAQLQRADKTKLLSAQKRKAA